jgi:hypothetical protein
MPPGHWPGRSTRKRAARPSAATLAARIARHGHTTIHLPGGWHGEHDWINLFRSARRPSLTSPPGHHGTPPRSLAAGPE